MTDYNIEYSQRYISFLPTWAQYVTISLTQHDTDTLVRIQQLAKQLDAYCQTATPKSGVVLGFDFALWHAWHAQLPKGMGNHDVFSDSPTITRSEGDIWFHIKGETKAATDAVIEQVLVALQDIIQHKWITVGNKRQGGKVFSQQFTDTLINPVDSLSLSNRIIVGLDDSPHRGATFAFVQKFQHDWEKLRDMSSVEMENMIGRTHDNTILPVDDKRSHIRSARVMHHGALNIQILRQGFTYGHSALGHDKEEGVYFVGYGPDSNTFDQLLRHMFGDQKGFTRDKLLNHTRGVEGNYWYIPSAQELLNQEKLDTQDVLENSFLDVQSKNGFMFYNTKEYLNVMAMGKYKSKDAPSNRILTLLDYTFSRWRSNWYVRRHTPPMGHLADYLAAGEESILQGSIVLRKGMAIKKTLSDLVPGEYGQQADVFRLDDEDVIVGAMPNLSLGMGKEVLRYLREDERIPAYLKGLNEFSGMGHIVPGYEKLLTIGVNGYIEEASALRDAATEPEKQDFYQAIVYTFEGVAAYCVAYADLAKKRYAQLANTEVDKRDNLVAIECRMRHLATLPPVGFADAAQLIFTLHCCLHLTGEPISVGRLDQLLIPFYERDNLTEAAAQEVIDSLWIKIGEKALLNRHHFDDTLTYGTTAVDYVAGNFPQGGAVNQWIQQVTVGGYLPNEDETPTDGCNAVTMLCLRATRRLPLNAPCLSLRVNTQTPKLIIDEAARAILSGGAMPILINDDKLCQGLKQSGKLVTWTSARNYACDGCYEAMLAGENEFAFSNLPALESLELALNQGVMYAAAGPVHIRGMKTSFRSKPATAITSFHELLDLYFEHFRWRAIAFFNDTLSRYGDVSAICPTPLLSSLVAGCLEKGRDLYDGGAKYHILAPMMIGLSNTIDSLYAIKRLVFDADTCVTTLGELVECLICDWGNSMHEPEHDIRAGELRAGNRAKRYRELREYALALPKFGSGHNGMADIAQTVVTRLCDIVQETIREPIPVLRDKLAHIKTIYGTDAFPFEFQVTPGVGTFEGYVGEGQMFGASADGRHNGAPLASDFSPAPSAQDKPVVHHPRPIMKSLADWNFLSAGEGLSNGSPTDINIREDFPLHDLENVIQAFANSEIGTNLLTITTANPETFENAAQYPEKYELVRARMGGWSEFFVAMFPEHQQQHRRRPLFESNEEES
tara:strand:+ start:15571 stop:19110 length:3540 start_codon:yes stop_codon:yes gene_type:complete